MVATSPQVRRYTIADLEDFPDDGKLRELVDGQIVEWDVPTYRHGEVEVEIAARVRNFVREHHLGRVVGGEVMVRIAESEYHARGADVAFYRHGRIPKDPDAPATVIAPDFVVEIISPSDRTDMTLAKVHDWLRTGVRLVWYVDPRTGDTTVYNGDRVTFVTANETLDGGDVVPGFQVCLADVLRALAVEEGAEQPGD